MSLAKDHQVIQALAAQRADQSFCNAILPWRSRSNRPVADPHRSDAGGEDMSVGPVIVTHQVSRCRDPWERLGDLPRKPLRRRMPGHLKPQQPPSAVSHNQEGKQPIEGHRRDHTQIDRGDGLGVIAQKGPPAL